MYLPFQGNEIGALLSLSKGPEIGLARQASIFWQIIHRGTNNKDNNLEDNNTGESNDPIKREKCIEWLQNHVDLLRV